MKRTYWLAIFAAVVLALIVGWFMGRGYQPQTEPSPSLGTADQPRKILYYRNPMGLPDTSPVPKKDSMGMDYLPVYEGGEAPAKPGTVILSAEKVQKLGVRTEPVRLRGLSPTVRASATVQIDETRQVVIAPKFEGWVEQLYANQTGMSVQRGQPLLSIYSPELVAAQNEFRVADAAARKLQGGDPASAATMRRLRDASRARLRNWGINDAHSSLVITSPSNAVILDKPIVQGARFAPGDTILRLADLSTVWLIAQVPASAAGAVAIGQRASFNSSTLPGQTFTGQVTFVQPVIDPQTRTVAIRIELSNPEGKLRPGLFGDVLLMREQSIPVLTVPSSAVLDSGTRQLVLVQVARGRFEPRSVVIGERSGDVIEIREGVREGERVVVAANFLIDAESNLTSALEGFSSNQEPEAIPATRASTMDIPATEPTPKDHSGHTKQQTVPSPAPAPENASGHDHSAMGH